VIFNRRGLCRLLDCLLN